MEKSFPNAIVWKMIGDEILFYLCVDSENILYESPKKTFDVLRKCIAFIEQTEKAKPLLSVKATLWSASVHYSKETSTHTNIIVKEWQYDDEILDFLGPDIDIGFRIAKYSLAAVLVIEAKLACLLTKLKTDIESNHISKYMRIVSCQQLKGVWDGRHYPIVWYRDDWTYSQNMFVYDEKYNSEIVHQIEASKGTSLVDVEQLTKIFSDLNRTSEIEDLRDSIVKTDNAFMQKKIARDKMGELHVVAVCANSESKILIAKRAANKDTLPDTWEFGCAQLHINQNFLTAINEGYENDFGVKVNFLQENPIGLYEVKKSRENNRVVPGIIFACRIVEGEDKITLDNSRHSEYRFINKTEFTQMLSGSELFVDDAEMRIDDVLKIIEQKSEEKL
jgi:isopentenyldiphosphate isomerase